MDFGEQQQRSLLTGGGGFGALRHPFVLLFHLGFRFGAIVFYVLANFFSGSFIIQFLVLLSLHSADLWAVKNVTGRLLAGVRWWNLVDAEGKNHWRFEVSQDPTKYDGFERQVFWAGLVAAPLFWLLLVSTAFLTLQWQWMVVAGIGAGMTGTNLYGYLRCKWNSAADMQNYLAKWAFLSMLKRNYGQPATSSSVSQQQQQPSPMRPTEIV